MPIIPTLLSGTAFADALLLNRAVYGGDDDLLPLFRNDYRAGTDPSNAGIRPALNVYDHYDTYLASFGLTTLGASEFGFSASETFTQNDLLPGDGNGLDTNWFYRGDLYRNHLVQTPGQPDYYFTDAAAVALAATRPNDTGFTLHLVFRGTDADLGKDGEAGTGAGQARYYGQLTPLIEKALAYAADPSHHVTEVVVSGHSLGGAMADMFALYDAAKFLALGVKLEVLALASAGIAPETLALRPDYDASLVHTGPDGTSFDTPSWYMSYDNAADIVRNPGTYDVVKHAQFDPQQVPVTNAAITLLRDHLHFDDQRLTVEVPLLDQYAVGAQLETNFLPQHYASLYELVGTSMAQVIDSATGMTIDRVIALGGRSATEIGTAGTNNVNAFGLPLDNTYSVAGQAGSFWLIGLSGQDALTGSTLSDILDGGAGHDTLVGGSGNDLLWGSTGKDVLAGDWGVDRMVGGAGGDRLDGGAGKDLVTGGGGDDWLSGGAGADRLTGGLGSDHFVFTGAFGSDTVTDFQQSNDVIDLSGLRGTGGHAQLTLADLMIGSSGRDAVVHLDLNHDGVADTLELNGDGRGDFVEIRLAGLSGVILTTDDVVF